MNDCPKHLGHDTMVPCLGCGRSFCRICDPPKGAGQYCPVCYREQLDRLSGRDEKEKPAAAMAAEAHGPGWRERIGLKEKAPRPEKKKREGRLGAVTEKALAPFRWIKARALGAGRKIKAAALFVARLPKRIAVFTVKIWRWLVHRAKDHFPVGLAAREALEGDPPFRESWRKMLAFVLGGAILLTVVVALAGQRNPGFSIGVSIIVAGGIVWAMDMQFGPTVAIVAAGLVLVSIVMGELFVQLLFRLHVIKRLDLQLAGLVSLNKPSTFYRSFAFKLVVWRLIPSAVVAGLIGWWPLKRRLSWIGLQSKDPKAIKVKPKRRPRPKPAADKPAGQLRVKEAPQQAVSREELEAAKQKASESAAADAE